MEPITITTTALGITLWEYLGKPFVDKAKDKYLEKTIDSVLSFLKIKDDDKKIIETELLKCTQDVLADKAKFLEFVNKNKKIEEFLKQEYHTSIIINGNIKGVVNANSGSIINQTIS
jgi:hypothetical protein